ncbi:interleukin-20-like [Pristis pectinata]|uniref:interleukin-20-like n=1 Tax=Pristis pectinata TaxID=685728 RepID=UPI00223DE72D|nr:interleukin-20-like [Pristis pectinata]
MKCVAGGIGRLPVILSGAPRRCPGVFKGAAVQSSAQLQRGRPHTLQMAQVPRCFTMQTLGAAYILAALLTSHPCAAHGRRLNFGRCTVTASMARIQEAFLDIKQAIQAEDATDDIRFLTRSTFNSIEAQESCCFLRHILRFYVETVFKHHTPSSPLIERRTSSLANSFLSIKILLRQCHEERKCHCGEETREKINLIQTTFEKMELNAAAVKAIGEIDILIDWMQQAHHE